MGISENGSMSHCQVQCKLQITIAGSSTKIIIIHMSLLHFKIFNFDKNTVRQMNTLFDIITTGATHRTEKNVEFIRSEGAGKLKFVIFMQI